MKKIFIFDFDYTIFDTTKFVNEFILLLTKHFEISENQFKESYKKSFCDIENCYDIFKHLKFLQININHQEIKNFFKDLNKFIFPFTKELLLKIKNNNNKIILLSKGNQKTQNLKIQNVDIKNLFNEIHIVQDQKLNWFLNKDFDNYKNSKIFFINDNFEENIELQKKIPNADIFLIDGPYSKNVLCNIKKYNLHELIELLPNNVSSEMK